MVVPAQAGTSHKHHSNLNKIPAFAGMTTVSKRTPPIRHYHSTHPSLPRHISTIISPAIDHYRASHRPLPHQPSTITAPHIDHYRTSHQPLPRHTSTIIAPPRHYRAGGNLPLIQSRLTQHHKIN